MNEGKRVGDKIWEEPVVCTTTYCAVPGPRRGHGMIPVPKEQSYSKAEITAASCWYL